jgi:hypothetical protein
MNSNGLKPARAGLRTRETRTRAPALAVLHIGLQLFE